MVLLLGQLVVDDDNDVNVVEVVACVVNAVVEVAHHVVNALMLVVEDVLHAGEVVVALRNLMDRADQTSETYLALDGLGGNRLPLQLRRHRMREGEEAGVQFAVQFEN